MKVVDSSVAVRALVQSADLHEPALEIVDGRPSIALHAALDTFSVITRLPEPLRVDARAAAQLIDDAFGGRVVPGVTPRNVTSWLRRLAESGIRGGAVYDAFVAESARLARATLVSADRRAAATYRAVGVEVEMLGE